MKFAIAISVAVLCCAVGGFILVLVGLNVHDLGVRQPATTELLRLVLLILGALFFVAAVQIVRRTFSTTSANSAPLR
jgi:hypothetical protein